MEATLEKNKKWYEEKNLSCQDTLTGMAGSWLFFGDKFGETEYNIEKWIVKNFHDDADKFMSELLLEIIERSFGVKDLSDSAIKNINFEKLETAKSMEQSLEFILDDIFKYMLSKEQEKEKIFLFNIKNFIMYMSTYGRKVVLEWLLQNLMTEFELKDVREFFNRMKDRKLSYNEVETFLYDNLDDLQEYVNTDDPEFRLEDEIVSYVKDIMFGKKFSNSRLILERKHSDVDEALRKAVTKNAYNIKIDEETGIPIPEEPIRFGHNNEQEILPKDYMSLIKGVHHVMMPVFNGLGIGNETEKRVIGMDKNQEDLLEEDDKEIINQITSDTNKEDKKTVEAEVVNKEKNQQTLEDEKDVEAVKEILNRAIKEAAPQDKKDLAIIKNTMTASVDKYNKAIGKLNSISKKSKPQNKKIFSEASDAIQELINKRQNK